MWNRFSLFLLAKKSCTTTKWDSQRQFSRRHLSSKCRDVGFPWWEWICKYIFDSHRSCFMVISINFIVPFFKSWKDRRIMRQSGYSFRGCRAEVRRQLSNWNPRITAIPIICTEGLIEIGIHRGTTNGDVFLQFVNERLVPNLLPFDGVNPRSVVIMGMIFCSTFKVLSAI